MSASPLSAKVMENIGRCLVNWTQLEKLLPKQQAAQRTVSMPPPLQPSFVLSHETFARQAQESRPKLTPVLANICLYEVVDVRKKRVCCPVVESFRICFEVSRQKSKWMWLHSGRGENIGEENRARAARTSVCGLSCSMRKFTSAVWF